MSGVMYDEQPIHPLQHSNIVSHLYAKFCFVPVLEAVNR